MNPVWKSIPNHADYLASFDGRIKRNNNELTIRYRDDGTPSVRVNVAHGEREDRPLDYLVALAHLGVPPRHHILIHLNGDKSDCYAKNLAYVPDSYREWVFINNLMRESTVRASIPADPSRPHGRLKVAKHCRQGHPLSMTGNEDENTSIWGVGNRICIRCRDRR